MGIWPFKKKDKSTKPVTEDAASFGKHEFRPRGRQPHPAYRPPVTTSPSRSRSPGHPLYSPTISTPRRLGSRGSSSRAEHPAVPAPTQSRSRSYSASSHLTWHRAESSSSRSQPSRTPLSPHRPPSSRSISPPRHHRPPSTRTKSVSPPRRHRPPSTRTKSVSPPRRHRPPSTRTKSVSPPRRHRPPSTHSISISPPRRHRPPSTHSESISPPRRHRPLSSRNSSPSPNQDPLVDTAPTTTDQAWPETQSPTVTARQPQTLNPQKVSPTASFKAQVEPAPAVVDVPCALEEICEVITIILNNKSRYKTLLGSRYEKAQSLLNLMQKMVDHQNIPADIRRLILITMMRLCTSSAIYPHCLNLQHKIHYNTKAVAEGRFGEIWKGKFKETHVSLKVAKLYQHSQIEHLLKSFAREAILWSQLQHPNVLPFYGLYRLGDAHDRICLVSLWMDNGNVSEYISANPQIARLPLVYEVLAGLEYLHENSVVHGDLKGANILVSSSGVACLADFGLSSVMDSEILRWTSLQTATPRGGTIRWEAPELIDDQESGGTPRPTFSSDIYAVASVMYEILTGQIPYYEFLREPSVIFKILKGVKPTKPPPEPELEMTDGIWETMEDCWQVDPNKRPVIKTVTENMQNTPLPQLTAKRMVPPQKGEQERNQLPPSPRTFRNIIQGQNTQFSRAEIGLLEEFNAP